MYYYIIPKLDKQLEETNFSEELVSQLKQVVEEFNAVRFFIDNEGKLIYMFKRPGRDIEHTENEITDVDHEGNPEYAVYEVYEDCAILDKDKLFVCNSEISVTDTDRVVKEKEENAQKVYAYLEKYKNKILAAKEYIINSLLPPLMYDARTSAYICPIRDLFKKTGILDEIKRKQLEESIIRYKREQAKPEATKILEKFDSIMIIPIKDMAPVLIFKMLGKPFYHEQQEIDDHIDDFIDVVIFDYRVYWGNKAMGYEFPVEIKHQYGDSFWNLINAQTVYYSYGDLPAKVIELPLKMVLGDEKIKIFSPNYITPVRDALRRIGLIEETRGKLKKQSISRRERNKKIIAIYREIVSKTKKKRPYPINIIFKRLTDYELSFATIRRVLDKYTKK
jgi:hypothetical protein